MKPNILLIVADQHRLDALGCAGRFPIQTPHIDRLAREGVYFTNAFTPCPVCAPARQALLSGRAPESFGALWNPDFIPTPTILPDAGFHTAALAQEGYGCTLIGKWNSSVNLSPSDFAFSTYIGYEAYNAGIAMKYPGLTYRNGWFGEPSPIALEDSKTHWAASQACAQIAAYTRQAACAGLGAQWFVRVDLTDPHLPCRPSEPFSSLYDPDAVEPWDSMEDPLEGKPYIQRQQVRNWNLEGRSWDEWKHTLAMYRGMVSQVDDAVGILLAQLDSLNMAEDTVVVYTADHGDLCGGHGMMDKHYVLYDDVTRVPLLIRYPRMAKAGHRAEEFVSNCLDLGATLGDLCDVMVSPGHGISLTPLLAGESRKERDFAVSAASGQQFGLYAQRCIRTKDWLYVWNMTDVDELYDATSDPGQKRNRIHQPDLTEVVGELRKRLYAELLRREDPFVCSGWLDAQLLEGKK